jgi:hypothetical protein
MKNTDPKFYENWGFNLLMEECARLNKLLDEINSDLEEVNKIFRGEK